MWLLVAAALGAEWGGGVFKGQTPCSGFDRDALPTTTIVFAGDSITRQIYHGVARTLCDAFQCAHYPDVNVNKIRCVHYTILSTNEQFRLSYLWYTPRDKMPNLFSPIGTLYWQSGLWILSNHMNATIEYERMVKHARMLCATRIVRRVYLVETLATLGGTQDNLWGHANLNRELHRVYTAAGPTECVRILPVARWPTNDYKHLISDKTHMSHTATLSFAPFIWYYLTGRCVPLSNHTSEIRVHDDWCQLNSAAIIRP
jgi:hypothetical protein